MKNEIILFENQNIKLEVNIKDETVWLNRKQLAELFDRDIKTISKHINNSLKEELDHSVVSKFATTAKDGKTYQVEYYNLDMIISVGYRVKSKTGIVFRKWATKVLREHLIKGYTINQKRLDYLEKTVKLIDIAGRSEKSLSGEEVKGIIKIINNYSKALNMLDNYDQRNLKKPKGNKNDKKITYKECIDVINILRYNTSSNLFALERSDGLKSIINDIYQTFDGKDLYESIEEKAANLLYLIIKNHIFIDGNKRVAACLFIYFLDSYSILYKENTQIIDNNALTSLTLLIAQSKPKEKDVLIDLVMNFLTL